MRKQKRRATALGKSDLAAHPARYTAVFLYGTATEWTVSIQDMSHTLGIDAQAVYRAVRKLEKIGLIKTDVGTRRTTTQGEHLYRALS